MAIYSPFAFLLLFGLLGCNTPTPSSQSPSDDAVIDTTALPTQQGYRVEEISNRIEIMMMPDEYYLSHPAIPDSAKWLYTKKVKPSDENYTFQVLEALDTTDISLLPFYFYTTIIISEQSDAAVSEMVGSTMHNFAINKPQVLRELFTMPNRIPGKTNREIWLDWTLSENAITNEGHEAVGIEKIEDIMLSNSPDGGTLKFTKQFVADLRKMQQQR